MTHHDTDIPGPIGVFDSGYGGLTILRQIVRILPQYKYLYLGDNARAPYGSRSFRVVTEFTLQAVRYMFDRGCQLVILACNTASAKALRTIQQEYLPLHAPARRVLGVIRPTVEALPGITRNGHIALMATAGTVASNSYKMEVGKIDPAMTITQQACPLFVPLIENGEADSEGAAYFVKKYIAELLARDPQTDTILLGCTHYPIIADLIRSHLPPHIKVIEQGELVGQSLKDYLHRHTEMEHKCLHSPGIEFITTEDPEKFNTMTKLFMGCQCDSTNVTLG